MNINELRAVLVDEIEKIRDGRTTAENVNAVTNATGKILAAVRLEMDYCRLLGVSPSISFITDSQKRLK